MSKYTDVVGQPITEVILVDASGAPAVASGIVSAVINVGGVPVSSGNPFSISLVTQLRGEDNSNVPIGVSSQGRMAVSPAFLETTMTLPTLNNAVIATNSTLKLGRTSTFWINVTTQLAWVTSQQATIQAWASRAVNAAQGGATIAAVLGTQGTNSSTSTSIVLNTTKNIGGLTTVPVGWYRYSAADFAELGNWDGYLGVVFVFGSALTSGVMTVYRQDGGC